MGLGFFLEAAFVEYPQCFNAVLREMTDVIAEILPDTSALTIAQAIQRRFGGGLVYIPMARNPRADRQARDAELCAEFTGNNHRALARKFGISVSTVYDALAAHRRPRTAQIDAG